MTKVYLLWHQHGEDDEEDAKLLGVYSTEAAATARQAEAVLLPGFRRFPDGFLIDGYELDRDEWTEGFATYSADGEWIDDPAAG